MGIGFNILYNKSEQDKQQLNQKIDSNTKQLENISKKLDMILSAKPAYIYPNFIQKK
jgi:hypothetical protein